MDDLKSNPPYLPSANLNFQFFQSTGTIPLEMRSLFPKNSQFYELHKYKISLMYPTIVFKTIHKFQKIII